MYDWSTDLCMTEVLSELLNKYWPDLCMTKLLTNVLIELLTNDFMQGYIAELKAITESIT